MSSNDNLIAPEDQNSCLILLIHQMSALSQFIDDIFGQLQDDFNQIQNRTNKLQVRVQLLLETSEKLLQQPLKIVFGAISNTFQQVRVQLLLETSEKLLQQPLKIGVTNLIKFTNVKNHHKAQYEVQMQLFTPKSRSKTLEQMYQKCGKVQYNFEEANNEGPLAQSTPVNQSPLEKHKEKGQTSQEETNQCWFDNHNSLPTPEERLKATVQQFQPIIVPVNTSGSLMERFTANRCAVRYQYDEIKSSSDNDRLSIKARSYSFREPTGFTCDKFRRNTIAGLVQETDGKYASTQSLNDADQQRRDTLSFDSSIKPIDERKTRFAPERKLLSNLHQFLSLRYPKKLKSPLIKSNNYRKQNYPTIMVKQNTVDPQEGKATSKFNAEKKPSEGTWKKFLHRSMSTRCTPKFLKLSPNKQDIYENYTPHNANFNLTNGNSSNSKLQLVTPAGIKQLPWRLRTNNSLDFDTCNKPKTLQYDHQRKAATELKTNSAIKHNNTNRKDVPKYNQHVVDYCSLQKANIYSLSGDICASNNSLDWNGNNCNGWYQQGFQMDYPEECKDQNCSAQPQMTSKVHLNKKDQNQQLSNQFEADDDFSVDDSSAFSCDQDGYYTSMHKDSGVLRRFVKQLTESPKLESKTNGILPSRKNSTGDNSNNNNNNNRSIRSPKIITPFSQKQNSAATVILPCDDRRLSLSYNYQSENFRNNAILLNMASVDTFTPHLENASVGELLDDWLLQKFQMEKENHNQTSGKFCCNNDVIDKPSLQNGKKNYALESARNCQQKFKTTSSTFPRKSVRFRQ